MRSTPLLRALPLLALLAGCGVLPTDAGGARPAVATDRAMYAREDPEGARVDFAIRNGGDGPVHLQGCPDPVSVVVQEEEGAGWRDAFQVNVYCPAIHAAARVALAPGEAYRYAVTVREAGRYRLRLYFGEDPGEPFARSAYSNAFEVR